MSRLQEQRKQIITALKENPDKTYREIASDLGLEWGQVSGVAYRNGLAHGRFRPRKLSERGHRRERDEKIIEYIRQHPELTYREVGDYFKLPHYTIGGVVYRSGFRRSTVTPEAKAKEVEIAEYIKSHSEMSYSDMGRELGLPTLRVANIARKHGLYRGKGQGPRHNHNRGGSTLPRTPEEREHLSEVMTQLWAGVSPKHRERLRRVMEGAWTRDRREKMSKALKGMWKEALAGK